MLNRMPFLILIYLFQALILYMYEALRGVKGFVMDEESGLPVHGAQMRIKGRQREFNTTTGGEYWRILLNGSYILQVYQQIHVLLASLVRVEIYF